MARELRALFTCFACAVLLSSVRADEAVLSGGLHESTVAPTTPMSETIDAGAPAVELLAAEPAAAAAKQRPVPYEPQGLVLLDDAFTPAASLFQAAPAGSAGRPARRQRLEGRQAEASPEEAAVDAARG